MSTRTAAALAKTDLILEKNGEKISIDVKSASTHKSAAPNVSLGPCR